LNFVQITLYKLLGIRMLVDTFYYGV
jgi:hypothetical protein